MKSYARLLTKQLLLISFIMLLFTIGYVFAYTETSWYIADNAFIDETGLNNLTNSVTAGLSLNTTHAKIGNASYWSPNSVGRWANSTTTTLSTGNHNQSVCFWAYTTASLGSSVYAVQTHRFSGASSYSSAIIGWENSNAEIRTSAEGKPYHPITFNTFSWQHFCYVYNTNKTISFYMNGTLLNSTAYTNTPTFATPSIVIMNNDLRNQGLNGLLDDIRIYDNYTLTQANVTELYNGGAGTNKTLGYSVPIQVGNFSIDLPSCGFNYSISTDGSVITGIYFNWTDSSNADNYTLIIQNQSNGYNKTIEVFTNLTTRYNWSASGLNASNGTWKTIVISYGLTNTSRTIIDTCTFTICQPYWQLQTQPCTDNARLIKYIDSNSCGVTYNLPATNGTYTNCTVLTSTNVTGTIISNTNLDLSDNLIIHLLLILLIIIPFRIAYKNTGLLKMFYSFSGTMIVLYAYFISIIIATDYTNDYQLLIIARLLTGALFLIGLILVFIGFKIDKNN